MRITVSTIARFHSFDLAAQLQARGHLAAVFTGYPRGKLRETGVDPALIRSFPWVQTPYMALLRYGLLPSPAEREMALLAHRTLDGHVARTLPDCDLVSVLSGSGVATGKAARRRGIAYVCDRGSTHIRFQDRLLAEEFERVGLPWHGIDRRVIERELEEYELADRITVPSGVVRDSFVTEGVAPGKLAVVPYGVDLGVFRRVAPRAPEFRILFVGGLSVRKGLHDLFAAVRLAGIPGARLVLVGGKTPETDHLLARAGVPFDWRGALSWSDLVHEFSAAGAFVLPSIEDGFGLVVSQAMACGCPVIVSRNVGGADLVQEGVNGFVVPARSPETIADRLLRLYRDSELWHGLSAAAVDRVRHIGGWRDYGDRSCAVFRETIETPCRRFPGPAGGAERCEAE
ncbi:glycosyltransferase family 4 protein [Rhodocista pekingensis]|uniref:Glycosyltransferase family 4 protein n=1 Tax=Rhodocista pekingensis TaxID=201185 RepID=A0ABW2L0J5_9PROT